MEYINLEYHPNDSRVRIADDEICQTLTSRMGTGGATYLLSSSLKSEERRLKTILKPGWRAK